jgi:23S rRNA pseudouridine2457 synthase
MSKKYHYYKVFKPYGMLSQFTSLHGDAVLGDLHDFPKDVYSVGRLDKDSEGLLLLTNDNAFKTAMLEPEKETPKTYLVQVDGAPSAEAIKLLESGTIIISHKGKKHQVAPAQCEIIPPPNLPKRSKPIRKRKNVPTTWLKLTIVEGKNRQVRKMTAAAGHPTLRLVRWSVDQFELGNMQPSDVVEFEV